MRCFSERKKSTFDILLVGDFLSMGVGLIWTFSSSPMLPSFSTFGSSMSAESDFLGTIMNTFTMGYTLHVSRRHASGCTLKREKATSFFPAIPNELLGYPPPSWLRA